MRDDVFYKIAGSFKNGTYVEHGYGFLNAALYRISFGYYHSLLIVSSALFSFAFFALIRNFVDKKWQPYAAFLFIGTGIFFASLNLTRQYWAISLIILAFVAFMKYRGGSRLKSIVLPTLLVLIASTFHLSSLISLLFIPFYVISKTKHARTIFAILIAVSIILMFVDIRAIITALAPILPGRWQWYMESRYYNSKNLLSVIKQVPILMMAAYSLVYYKDLKKNKYFLPAISLFVINTIITNAVFGVMVLLRLSYYFDFSILLLLPIILSDIRKRFSKPLFVASVICSTGYYIALTVVTIFIMNGHGVMPYNSLIGGF